MDDTLDIAIIGAGIAGISAAVQLTRAFPKKRIALFERRARVGGTWDLFRYPGIRCDSDMYTLGFGFKPWTHAKSIVGADVIRGYVEEAAEENDILPLIQFSTRLTRANWSSEAQLWTMTLIDEDSGEARTCQTRMLYMASGYYDYDEGFRPALPQEDAFAGTIIHPQHWPQGLDYTDKRVTIVGSGATAMTLLPAMTDKAAHVTMLQRSPTYVISRPSTDGFSSAARAFLPERWAYNLIRLRNRTLQRFLFRTSRNKPEKVRNLLLGEVRKAIGEKVDVDAHFTPRYNPWEERLCLIPDGDMFDALNAGKASVVTDEIAGFTAVGPVLKSTGAVLPSDIIVLATGLKLALFGKAELSVDGQLVNGADRMIYKGCMLSGVPNMIFVFGYTNAAWTLKADLVAAYAARVVAAMDQKGYAVATAPSPPDSVGRFPMIDFNSGYFRRAAEILPAQGDSGPWTLVQDYPFDKRRLLKDPVADGVLQFH